MARAGRPFRRVIREELRKIREGGLSGFLGGVLCTQFVNSAMHLAQPLLLARLSGSLAKTAFFLSFDTAVHMLGTFLGGWPTDRIGARRVLIGATFLRALALGAIPLAMIRGTLTLDWAMVWYTVDALVRGFVDAAEYSLPLEMVGPDAAQLDAINSRFELVFDLGGVAGPLLLGALMLGFKGVVVQSFVPLGFLAAAGIYLTIPRTERVKPLAAGGSAKKVGTWVGLRKILANPMLLISCLGLMFFNIFPLRKMLSAFFAKAILKKPAAAGVLGAAFGLGGIFGALTYSRRGARQSDAIWIPAGAVGMIVLALGWIPGSLWIMVAAAFVFAFTNVGARLVLTRIRQEHTPLEILGGVTAASRFASNCVSVALKALVGVAFAFGMGPRIGFSGVAIVLVLIALGQLTLSGYLSGRRTALPT